MEVNYSHILTYCMRQYISAMEPKLSYRGHGTFADENNRVLASVTGTVEIVNKLISVKPLKTRYRTCHVV